MNMQVKMQYFGVCLTRAFATTAAEVADNHVWLKALWSIAEGDQT